MTKLVFEAYGALCFFAWVAFLVLASVAKLRPDLVKEEFDLSELEKPVNSERSGDALSIEPPIIEEPSCWTAPRPVKQSKRLIRRRPHHFHTRRPHTI
jgi:hypothetical protein